MANLARLVAAVSAGSTNQNSATTPAVDMTGANFLVAAVASSAAATATLSDSEGNTWTALSAVTLGDARLQVYYVQAPTVGAAQTFTVTGSLDVPSLCVMGFTNVAATPKDQDASATSAGATSLSTGSITPTQDNELLIFAANVTNAVAPRFLSNGFAIGAQQPGVSTLCYGSVLGYQLQDTAAAVSTTVTWPSSTPANVQIISFKTTGGGGGAAGGAYAFAG